MTLTFPQTARITARRLTDRVSYGRATAYAIIDESYLCHLGYTVDGGPRVLPTLQVRIDDTLYVHGSTGSGPLLAARAAGGMPICVTVTRCSFSVQLPNTVMNAISVASRPTAIRTRPSTGANLVASISRHAPSSHSSTTAWKSGGSSCHA